MPSLNVVVRIDSAAGNIMAAPRPWARRAPIRTPELPARPPASDETAKSDGAGDEDAAATEQVGGPTAEQHEPAVGEQVGARHPLQALDREMQVTADRGQGDVDDGGVDEVEEGDGAQQHQRQLASASGEERRLSEHCRHVV